MTEDLTGCSHDWEPSMISYLVGGIEDYQCARCGAHGQKRVGYRHAAERGSPITYCHGGEKT